MMAQRPTGLPKPAAFYQLKKQKNWPQVLHAEVLIAEMKKGKLVFYVDSFQNSGSLDKPIGQRSRMVQDCGK